MKLKLCVSNTDVLLSTLSAIQPLRKLCVLRFTPVHLCIISMALNEPQAWCKISQEVFPLYEVESIRDNVLCVETNIDPLINALRNFDKSNSDGLSIRLQRRPVANEGPESSKKNRSMAVLSLIYTEHVSMASSRSYSFKIPVKVLKAEIDQGIVEPQLTHAEVLMKLDRDILPLFRRIERYKRSGYICVTGTNRGRLELSIEEDSRKVQLSWKEFLQVQQLEGETQQQSQFSTQDQDMPHSVQIKLKDWRLGAKLTELCYKVVMIISENHALVLHCILNEDETAEVTYYIGGKIQDQE
ncbi:DNA damage and meiotic pachytene checkpoint protein [Komagataella phaffii CBS 7435]|uniref:Checkpoint protein n=2 Tax=Komagataella phaffii TaxID=460519 RepID=C4R4X7_KOMPG|nr:Hypothetical protein PAS_chr3_0565 [Komagataella phaffii GS115]AOA63970.1 GQ67_03640T0 [Komagataella phaffii]CAH2449620.1 DNA damage and meiotic pachytene checkpoint protein [Komagataella phaffii CBS 7435]AOA69025.1 GQ68_03612T0 [Komagataella phaffii GS115]CAY70613.1 Hypothetical protein PAS_chr3_0565 [Komagataella phaffii GS115]CCA39598.2 DNA damage and meiotic pachytene checkpoint protein [Komagataella phaffii CBS 7435]